MSVSGSINSVTESASFTYDLQRRLVTSANQANGSGSVDRQYSYDRWGNRTSVYDKISGGNLIQSINLVQSSSIPNNQIASVTEGSTPRYCSQSFP